MFCSGGKLAIYKNVNLVTRAEYFIAGILYQQTRKNGLKYAIDMLIARSTEDISKGK